MKCVYPAFSFQENIKYTFFKYKSSGKELGLYNSLINITLNIWVVSHLLHAVLIISFYSWTVIFCNDIIL